MIRASSTKTTDSSYSYMSDIPSSSTCPSHDQSQNCHFSSVFHSDKGWSLHQPTGIMRSYFPASATSHDISERWLFSPIFSIMGCVKCLPPLPVWIPSNPHILTVVGLVA